MAMLCFGVKLEGEDDDSDDLPILLAFRKSSVIGSVLAIIQSTTLQVEEIKNLKVFGLFKRKMELSSNV